MRKQLWLLLASITVLVTGCLGPSRIAPSPSPDHPASWAAQPLTATNAQQARTVGRLTAKQAFPVAALAFRGDDQELRAVYGGEGTLRYWRIRDATLIHEADLGAFGLAAATFDAMGNTLALAAGATEPAIAAGHAAEVDGVRVFELPAGTPVLASDAERDEHRYTDLAFSPDGARLIGVQEGSINYWNVTSGERLGGMVVGASIDPYIPRSNAFAAVTFDPTGELYAYASETGVIMIETWACDTGSIICRDRRHSWQMRNSGETLRVPLALMFDPQRRWLASLDEQALALFDVRWNRDIWQKDLVAGPLGALAFNNEGSLLAVGSASGFQLWDAARGRLLVEDKTQPVYAVAFSHDDRLVAWGDASGEIHLWGVPQAP